MVAAGFATDKLNVKYVDYKILVNGNEAKLKNRPLLKDGDTTYLPLRELSELVGYDVDFNKGVITLDDPETVGSQTTVSPVVTPAGTPSPTPAIAEAIEWKKLPQTWEQDGISITVDSIEITNGMTVFQITASNNSSGSMRINLDKGIIGNRDVQGKQEKSYLAASSVRSFDNPVVYSGKEASGPVRKSKIDDGTETVVLIFDVNGGKYKPTFYIDTKDIWE